MRQIICCPGSLAMQRNFPNISNEYSAEGTAAHGIAAECLEFGKQAASFPNKWKADGLEGEFEVSDYTAIQVYVDGIREKIEGYKLLGAKSCALEVEQRVPIGHITGEEGAEGTADAILIVTWPDETMWIDVSDLKFGRGKVVEAEGNEQGMMYALGAMEKFGFLGDFTKVIINIWQPRLRRAPSVWEPTMETLHAFSKTVKMVMDRALVLCAGQQPILPADLKSGDHCQFCRAKAACPRLAADIEEEIGAAFATLQKDEAPIAMLPETSLSQKMTKVDLIEWWCKAVRAETERRLLSGVTVPGWKLVQGKKGIRTWADAEQAEARLKHLRLRQDQIYSFKVLSPVQVEKTLGEKIYAKVVDLVTQSEGGPSVQPATDPRPAIQLSAPAETFPDLGNMGGLL
jgi:hypothetical protein